MRNLLLFLLILIGVYYLRRLLAGDKGDDRATTSAASSAPPSQAEQVLPCAQCGLLVPLSEGVEVQGLFFCCTEHAGQGPAAR